MITARSLAEALEQIRQGCTELRVAFDGRSNIASSEGIKELAAALKDNTTLTTLHLYYGWLGDEGAKELAAALKANATLTTLHFGGNDINDQAVLAAIESLVQRFFP